MTAAHDPSGHPYRLTVKFFGNHAVEAFENEAVDYLLKPVTSERLKKTVRRLKEQMEARAAPPSLPAEMMQRLMDALAGGQSRGRLRYIRVQHGEGIRLIPVDEAIYFKASDKYTLVEIPDAPLISCCWEGHDGRL